MRANGTMGHDAPAEGLEPWSGAQSGLESAATDGNGELGCVWQMVTREAERYVAMAVFVLEELGSPRVRRTLPAPFAAGEPVEPALPGPGSPLALASARRPLRLLG